MKHMSSKTVLADATVAGIQIAIYYLYYGILGGHSLTDHVRPSVFIT
jgi:hypothetical protein